MTVNIAVCQLVRYCVVVDGTGTLKVGGTLGAWASPAGPWKTSCLAKLSENSSPGSTLLTSTHGSLVTS